MKNVSSPKPSFIRTTYPPTLERLKENHHRVRFLNSGFYWMMGILLLIATVSGWLFFRNVGYAYLFGPIGILIGALFQWGKLNASEKQHCIELKDGHLWVGNPEPLRNIGKVIGALSVYLTGQEDPEWTDGSSRLYLLIKPDHESEHYYPLFIDTNTTEKIGTAIAKAVNCPFTQAKGKTHLPQSVLSEPN